MFVVLYVGESHIVPDIFYYCPINYALSQFLYACFDLAYLGYRSAHSSTGRDKNMCQRFKNGLVFYKYVTSPRLICFLETKQKHFVVNITI